MLKIGERVVVYIGTDGEKREEQGFVTIHGDVVKIHRKEENEYGGYDHTKIEIFKERVVEMRTV